MKRIIRRTAPIFLHHNRADKKGVSLIEVMVTICIISIMAGMVSVSLRPLWGKHQLRLGVKELIGQIQLLRMKAILEKCSYQIRIANSRLSYRKKKQNQWESWKNFKLKDDIEYTMKGNVYFYSKGFASPKTITLRHDKYSQKIIVNINGRARTSKVF